MNLDEFMGRPVLKDLQVGEHRLPEPDWVLPITHLSASSITRALECPRAWQQKYIHKREEPKNSNLVLGSAVHQAIDWAVNQTLDDRDVVNTLPFLEETEGYFRYARDQQLEEAGGIGEISWELINRKTYSPDDMRDLGSRMTRTYTEQVIPRLQVTDIEQEFELDVGLPVPVKGFIDFVQGEELPVVDVKTSASSMKEIKPRWRPQGRIYSLAMNVPVDWHIVTKQVQPQVVTSLEVPELLQGFTLESQIRTVEMIQAVGWRLNDLYKQHGPDGEWPWASGLISPFACSYCSFKHDCPGWEGLL